MTADTRRALDPSFPTVSNAFREILDHKIARESSRKDRDPACANPLSAATASTVSDNDGRDFVRAEAGGVLHNTSKSSLEGADPIMRNYKMILPGSTLLYSSTRFTRSFSSALKLPFISKLHNPRSIISVAGSTPAEKRA